VKTPCLFLLSQGGQEEKRCYEDGSLRSYHNVAKNVSFSLVIGQKNSTGTPLIQFGNLGVRCTLVYDQDRSKTVEVLSQKPMEYKVSTLRNGTQLKVDARIKVLSSQLECSLFCIHVEMFDSSNSAVPELSVYSQPIRVRSKVKSSAAVAAAAAAAASGSVLESPNCEVSPKKRPSSSNYGAPAVKRERMSPRDQMDSSSQSRSSSDICEDDLNNESAVMSQMSLVLQALDRIEQRQQRFMDQSVANKKFVGSPSYGSPDNVSPDFQSEACVSTTQPHVSFSCQFMQLLSEFSQMPEHEKQAAVGVIQNSVNADQVQSLFWMLEPFTTTASTPVQQIVKSEECVSMPPVFPSFDAESLF